MSALVLLAPSILKAEGRLLTPSFAIKDEGTLVVRSTSINCVGAGITCTQEGTAGARITVTATGGGVGAGGALAFFDGAGSFTGISTFTLLPGSSIFYSITGSSISFVVNLSTAWNKIVQLSLDTTTVLNALKSTSTSLTLYQLAVVQSTRSLVNSTGTYWQDEGVSVFSLPIGTANCAGAGITCTQSGGILTITVPGGGVGSSGLPLAEGASNYLTNPSSGTTWNVQNSTLNASAISATTATLGAVNVNGTGPGYLVTPSSSIGIGSSVGGSTGTYILIESSYPVVQFPNGSRFRILISTTQAGSGGGVSGGGAGYTSYVDNQNAQAISTRNLSSTDFSRSVAGTSETITLSALVAKLNSTNTYSAQQNFTEINLVGDFPSWDTNASSWSIAVGTGTVGFTKFIVQSSGAFLCDNTTTCYRVLISTTQGGTSGSSSFYVNGVLTSSLVFTGGGQNVSFNGSTATVNISTFGPIVSFSTNTNSVPLSTGNAIVFLGNSGDGIIKTDTTTKITTIDFSSVPVENLDNNWRADQTFQNITVSGCTGCGGAGTPSTFSNPSTGTLNMNQKAVVLSSGVAIGTNTVLAGITIANNNGDNSMMINASSGNTKVFGLNPTSATWTFPGVPFLGLNDTRVVFSTYVAFIASGIAVGNLDTCGAQLFVGTVCPTGLITRYPGLLMAGIQPSAFGSINPGIVMKNLASGGPEMIMGVGNASGQFGTLTNHGFFIFSNAVTRILVNANGSIGIGSATTPSQAAGLDVNGGSVTVRDLVVGGVGGALTLRTSTGAPYEFQSSTSNGISHVAISTEGHLTFNGPTPSIGTGDCGSTPEGTVDGTDIMGTITVGGGVVTSCKITWAVPFAATPYVVATDNSTTVPIARGTINNVSATFTSATSISGGLITYFTGVKVR